MLRYRTQYAIIARISLHDLHDLGTVLTLYTRMGISRPPNPPTRSASKKANLKDRLGGDLNSQPLIIRFEPLLVQPHYSHVCRSSRILKMP